MRFLFVPSTIPEEIYKTIGQKGAYQPLRRRRNGVKYRGISPRFFLVALLFFFFMFRSVTLRWRVKKKAPHLPHGDVTL